MIFCAVNIIAPLQAPSSVVIAMALNGLTFAGLAFVCDKTSRLKVKVTFNAYFYGLKIEDSALSFTLWLL